MKWLRSRTAVVALVAVVAASTIALGTWQGWLAEAQTVRWVNDADDAGEPTECSTTTAYANISAALGASADGDIIRLCEGTYAGNITIGVEVTIEGREGADRAAVVIEETAANDGLIVEADDVTISHLVLDGSDSNNGILMAAPGYSGLTISDVEATDWDNAINTDRAQNMVIEGCHLHDNAFDGVYMTDGLRNVVRGSEIADNGIVGIDAYAEDELLVEANTISGNDSDQIAVYERANVRIHRNEIVTVTNSHGVYLSVSLPAEAFVQIGGSPENANSFSGPFDPAAGEYYVELDCAAENTVDATYNYWGGAGLSRSDIANRIFNDEDDAGVECPLPHDGAVVFHPWATEPAPTPSPSPTPTPSPTPSPTVSPTPSATRTFDLPLGWNNFVWTGADGTAAETVFSCIAGPPAQFAIAYALDAGSWLRYVPDDPDITTLITVDQYDSMLVLITASGVQCADMPVEP